MIGSLFSWDKFVTPSLVRFFYWINLVLIALGVIAGVISSFVAMTQSFFGGLLALVGTLLAGVMFVLLARMFAEMFQVAFLIEDHLAAVRKRWEA